MFNSDDDPLAEDHYNEAPFEVPRREPFNPMAMMHGHGWKPGIGGTNVYIDGSTGFRHGGLTCGIAIYWLNHYWGYSIPKMGPNLVELEAFKRIGDLIRIRPLLVYTDSSFVQSRCKNMFRDVSIMWCPRRSSKEMRVVDTLARLCACSGQDHCGVGPSELALEKELMAIYDSHYGKGSPHAQGLTCLA